MKPEFEQLKKDILFEQDQIGILISKIKEIEDNITEVNTVALGAYLMNFYNGIENIMKRCAKEYYKKIPETNDWHKQLLQQSYGHDKNPLFSKEVADKLYNYLVFRHFLIHGYSFNLNRNKMISLIDNIDELWRVIKSQVAEFINKI